MSASAEFNRLIEIMAQLRDPKTGCPWDIEQDFRSIRHFTIEEAYEVSDAIEREDYEDLCSELGDLILQPVFHAQMAAEAQHFEIEDVVRGINQKLIRRHPHIFDMQNQMSSDGVLSQWEDIKTAERAQRSSKRGEKAVPSILEDVPSALPALLRAEKLAKRVSKIGFDWPDISGALAKIREELNEVEVEIERGNTAAIHQEIGDLLFAVASLARKAGVAPEAALSDANSKFVRRFSYVETRCSQEGVEVADAGLDKLQAYWDEIRASDKETNL